ncbi:MAG: hypothetical protein BMS9Abin10_0682 [Gammaproteobacteria bacterium]|nr:MAG: hypothetical protein BMS9Abin10_0682 [Gammaproteobacteria bacterium]
MITVTENAAAQIRGAARQGGMEGMALRIAAKRKPDGSIDYAMGFDDITDHDTRISAHGVDIVVTQTSAALLENTVLDYVELKPDGFEFIFMNPNDPGYVAPGNEPG